MKSWLVGGHGRVWLVFRDITWDARPSKTKKVKIIITASTLSLRRSGGASNTHTFDSHRHTGQTPLNIRI